MNKFMLYGISLALGMTLLNFNGYTLMSLLLNQSQLHQARNNLYHK